MKIKGKTFKGPSVEHVIIPRTGEDGEPDDVVFTLQAVLDFEEFEKVYPMPVPREIIKPDKSRELDANDPVYLDAIGKRNGAQMKWMILKSMEATEGLEFDKVDMEKPETWDLFDEELKEAGFTQLEVGRIIKGAMDVNGINSTRIEEAKKRFLATRLQKGAKA